MNLDSRLLRVL